jgi:hypothetical protein
VPEKGRDTPRAAAGLNRITITIPIRIKLFRTDQCFFIKHVTMSVARELTAVMRKMQAVGMQRDLRRSQETRIRFWHAAIVSSFFVAAVGASLFLGAVIVAGTLGDKIGSNELTADGRTGRVTRSLRDGTLCHYIVFDNKTSQAIEDRVGRCDENKPKPRQERPPAFSWGGK